MNNKENEDDKPIEYRGGQDGNCFKAYLAWKKAMPMENHRIPAFVAGYNAAVADMENK